MRAACRVTQPKGADIQRKVLNLRAIHAPSENEAKIARNTICRNVVCR
jgi:hypothetical protein